jgi:hypothetical protein
MRNIPLMAFLALTLGGSTFGQSISCDPLFGNDEHKICWITDARGHERFTEIDTHSTRVITKKRYMELTKQDAQWQKEESARTEQSMREQEYLTNLHGCLRNPRYVDKCAEIVRNASDSDKLKYAPMPAPPDIPAPPPKQ